MPDKTLDDDTKEMLRAIDGDDKQEPIQDGSHLLDDHAVDEEPVERVENESDNSDQPSVEVPSNHDPVIAPVDTKKRRFSKRTLSLLVLLGFVLLGAVFYMLMFKEDPSEIQQSSVDQDTAEVQRRFGVAVGLVEGIVQYSTDDTTWQAITTDTDLKEGDSVKTADGARAVLLIDDGSAVRLDANTEVNLKSLATNDVRIDNVKGQVYTRVVASESRRFGVYSDGEIYLAKGTAYRTISTDTEKGVQVFHSKVEVTNKQTEVGEGNAFFTKSTIKEKEGVVSAINIDTLKDDAFIKWNAEQDKTEQAFADKLGVLTEIDKPKAVAEKPKPTPAPSSSTKGSITLRGSQSDSSAVFSWTVTGLDTSGGFKLVRSAKSNTPTYPENSIVYIEKGKTSYTYSDKDGGTYNYRLCVYRDNKCDNYSNVVTVTTNKKENPVLKSGTITLNINGTNVTWTDTGSAVNGYKFVMSSTTSEPKYPDAEINEYTGSTSRSVPTKQLTAGTTYSIRVCRYTFEGTCIDYSNTVTYTP